MNQLQKLLDESTPDYFIVNNSKFENVYLTVLSYPYDVLLSFTEDGIDEEIILTEDSLDKHFDNEPEPESIVVLDNGRDFDSPEIAEAADLGKTIGTDGQFLASGELRLRYFEGLTVVLFYPN